MNNKTVNLKISRLELCDILISLTGTRFDLEQDARNPKTSETRREIDLRSAEKWRDLHDKLKAILEDFDEKHPVEEVQ